MLSAVVSWNSICTVLHTFLGYEEFQIVSID